MRSLRLLGAAAEAESLRLRRQAVLAARQGVWYAVAGGFGLAAAIMLHVAGWIALDRVQGPLVASLVLAGVDLAVMVALLLLARPKPDPVVQAALLLRERSMAEFHASPLLDVRSPAMAAGMAVAESIARAIFRR